MPENKLDRGKLQKLVKAITDGETFSDSLCYAAFCMAIILDQGMRKQRGKPKSVELVVKSDALSSPFVASCREGRASKATGAGG